MNIKKQTKKSKEKDLKKLKKKLWGIVSEYVRRRDNGICITCGKREWDMELGQNNWKVMQCGHYRHGRLDYDEMNLNCQCVHCNYHLSGNLGKYTLKLSHKYGIEAVEELDKRADMETGGKKYLEHELEELIYYYQAKLKELE